MLRVEESVENRKIYLLGTIWEIAEYIFKEMNIGKRFFPMYDYALVELNDKEKDDMPLEIIEGDLDGWYGIHMINSGFNYTEGIEVMANYWGGGSGVFVELYEGCNPIAEIEYAMRTAIERDNYYPHKSFNEQLLIAVGRI